MEQVVFYFHAAKQFRETNVICVQLQWIHNCNVHRLKSQIAKLVNYTLNFQYSPHREIAAENNVISACQYY